MFINSSTVFLVYSMMDADYWISYCVQLSVHTLEYVAEYKRAASQKCVLGQGHNNPERYMALLLSKESSALVFIRLLLS